MKSEFKVSLSEIQAAHSVLSAYLQPTPLLRNAWLSEQFGCDLYLKLENMQPIGSFKIRGATYKIARLSAEEKKRGVIAASAGNHAQGVAWGSQKVRVDAQIVMPVNAPLMKIQNTKSLGAKVILHGSGYDDAYARAQEIANETGRVFVHAFADETVVAGQGSLGIELIEQLPDIDAVVSSVGGGGLLAGVSTAIKSLKPSVRVYGCQAKGSPSMVESIRVGKAVRLQSSSTFADGIAVRNADESLRKLLSATVDQWITRDDEDIAAAILTLLEKAKVIAEGAAALPLAALEEIRSQIIGKKVVLIIGGGNIDVNVLGRIIDRGLIRSGRRLRTNVWIHDRPGSLAQLTELLAEQGANIIQAIHDRDEPSTQIDQTEVALTLETKGPDHTDRVLTALKEHVLRLEVIH